MSNFLSFLSIPTLALLIQSTIEQVQSQTEQLSKKVEKLQTEMVSIYCLEECTETSTLSEVVRAMGYIILRCIITALQQFL